MADRRLHFHLRSEEQSSICTKMNLDFGAESSADSYSDRDMSLCIQTTHARRLRRAYATRTIPYAAVITTFYA